MQDCVKGCREVQDYENADVVGVSSNEEVIGNVDKSGLHAVVRSEARLKGFRELIVGHVLTELGSNCSFQDLLRKRRL